MTGLLRLVAILTLVLQLQAADAVRTAPAGGDHIQALGELYRLRTRLAAAPDDQAVLGEAIMAYVALCWEGHPDRNGAYGTMLVRARELADRRARARHGKPAATLAEAAPELWVDGLEGRSRQVVDALEHWPAEAASKPAVALRTYARHDWSGLDPGVPQPYPLCVAAADAAVTNGHYMATVGFLSNGIGIEQRVQAYGLYRNPYMEDIPAIVHRTLATVVGMLDSPDLAEDAACRHLAALCAAWQAPLPAGPASTRPQLRAAAWAAAQRADIHAAPTYLGAIAVSEACRAGPSGLGDGAQLAGLGDIACWNLSRLQSALQMAARMLWSKSEKLLDPIEAAHPGYLAVWWKRAVDHDERPEVIAGLIAAIDRADPAIVAPADLVTASIVAAAPDYEQLNTRRASGVHTNWRKLDPAQAEKLATALARQADACQMTGPYRRDLPDLALLLGITGRSSRLASCLRAAAQADPWSLELAESSRLWNGEQAMASLDDADGRVATDARIDHPALPWDGFPEREWFAARWEGSIMITKPGIHAFALEVDDIGRFRLPGLCLDSPVPGSRRRVTGTIELAGGRLPLTLEYRQQDRGACCRLLWRQPGDQEWTPVPAEAFSNPTGGAGLTVRIWAKAGKRAVIPANHPDLIAMAKAMPWTAASFLIGERLSTGGQSDEAMPWLLDAVTTRRDYASSRLACVNALRCSKPDPALILRLMKDWGGLGMIDSPDWLKKSGEDNPRWLYSSIVADIERSGLIEDSWRLIERDLANESTSPRFTYAWQARLAMARGDWAAAVRLTDAFMDCGSPEWTATGGDIADQLMVQAIVGRATGRGEPDWDKLEQRMAKYRMFPGFKLSLAFLSGEAAAAGLEQRMSTTESGDVLLFHRGLLRMTTGDHDGALADFAKLVELHPTWWESAHAQAIARWLAGLGPAERARLPRAKPLPVATPATPKDF